jgi:4'-phosphopantetheinyl transferase
MTTCLWWVRPEAIQSSSATLALLSDDERQQQQRYLSPLKRHEHLATRVLVRSLLGDALGVAPASLQFVHNEWGRPALVPASSSAPVHFNLSHTDGLIVCLVSSQYQVGVDTELLARAPELLALGSDVFAAKELKDLAALPLEERAQRAVVLWTLKESYIKARGMGLALPLDGFAFRFADGRISLELEPSVSDDGLCWQFQTLVMGQHCISLAIFSPAGARLAVEIKEWPAKDGRRAF